MASLAKKADLPTSQVRRYLEPGPIVLVSSAHVGRTNIKTMECFEFADPRCGGPAFFV